MKRHINIPNTLSLARGVAVVPIWYLLDYGYVNTAFIVYLVALATDFLDGWLAVRLNQVTDVGKLLDPWADKVLHIMCLIMFLEKYPELKIAIYAVIALALVLIGLAAIKVYWRVKRPLGANIFGKIKMCLEGAAMIALFLQAPTVGGGLLFTSVLFALLSILGHIFTRDHEW